MLKQYEGMFLFDPAVTSDWDNVKTELDRLMERAGARIILCGKWDERRLAYEIRGVKRGIYALAYFEAEPSKIVDLERDVQLSESALRCMILRADDMTQEQMQEAIDKPASQSDEGEDRRYGHRDRERRPAAPSGAGVATKTPPSAAKAAAATETAAPAEKTAAATDHAAEETSPAPEPTDTTDVDETDKQED